MAGTYRPPSGASPRRIAWLATTQLVGADAEHEIHLLFITQFLQYADDGLGSGQVGVGQLQERVHKDGAHVEVGGKDAAHKTDEHVGVVNMIIVGVDKPDLVVHVEHVTVVVVQEDHVVNRFPRGAVGQVNQPLRFTGALLACDYLYHGNTPPLYGCFLGKIIRYISFSCNVFFPCSSAACARAMSLKAIPRSSALRSSRRVRQIPAYSQ